MKINISGGIYYLCLRIKISKEILTLIPLVMFQRHQQKPQQKTKIKTHQEKSHNKRRADALLLLSYDFILSFALSVISSGYPKNLSTFMAFLVLDIPFLSL